MKITDFQKRKLEKTKISMVTCYDFTSARIVSRSKIDSVLVGDSAAMMMHGESQTVGATIEMMAWHTRAVARGLAGSEVFLVADLPFPTVHLGEIEAMRSVDALVIESFSPRQEGDVVRLEVHRYIPDESVGMRLPDA